MNSYSCTIVLSSARECHVVAHVQTHFIANREHRVWYNFYPRPRHSFCKKMTRAQPLGKYCTKDYTNQSIFPLAAQWPRWLAHSTRQLRRPKVRECMTTNDQRPKLSQATIPLTPSFRKKTNHLARCPTPCPNPNCK
jgi:hypothetical protein